MTKQNAMKWINALRSGKYKQTQNTLQEFNGYCCLGVACEVFKIGPLIKNGDNFIYGGLPSDQYDNLHFHRNHRLPDFVFKLEDYDFDMNGKTYRFQDLNDSLGLTFNEIADIIQIEFIEGL